MKYFILSTKWTKNNGAETWWRANENGYTTFIARAGVYTEEDKVRLEKRETDAILKFIPITYDLFEKGLKQLSNEEIDLDTGLREQQERLKLYEQSVNEEKKVIQGLTDKLVQLADELGGNNLDHREGR
jgi:hypothetical protein